jgi:hypothetical protein
MINELRPYQHDVLTAVMDSIIRQREGCCSYERDCGITLIGVDPAVSISTWCYMPGERLVLIFG